MSVLIRTVLLYFVCLYAIAQAESVSVDFTLDPAGGGTNEFELTMTLATALGTTSDRADIVITGNILADFDIAFDRLTEIGTISNFQFTGGVMALSDYTLSLGYFGGIAGVDVTSTGVQGFADTPLPPSLVVNGGFESSEQDLVLTNGVMNAVPTGAAVGQVAPTNIVLTAANPIRSAMGTEQGAFVLPAPQIVGTNAIYELSGVIPVFVSSQVISNATMVADTVIVGTAYASTTFVRALSDSDSDGDPDVTDPDDDNDGFDDASELIAGTDAFDAASVLSVHIQSSSGSAELIFPTLTNRLYSIDARSNVLNGAWVNVATNLLGTGSPVVIPMSADTVYEVFRLGVKLTP